MKKIKPETTQDKEDWKNFTRQLENIYDKDEKSFNLKDISHKRKKLDLHGFSLEQANLEVKKFINTAFENGYKKILIITGKGTRSHAKENPYLSEKLSVLKHSVPEFIKGDKELLNKIKKISNASPREGGDGALDILLRN